MKKIKYFLSTILLIIAVWSCVEEDFGNTDFVSTATAPNNVAALYNITQDNTGLVTITPNSEGAVSYDIYFGDETTEPENVKPGSSISHTYKEGSYTIKVVAHGISGLTTEESQELVVSFIAPENLEVTVLNDEAISKQVNVTATADFATSFEVYFGEVADETPVVANIGDTASYVYQEAGIYTIRVVAIGAAIATTEFIIEDFEVTAILQPLEGAPTPQGRQDADVISIYSDSYASVEGSDFNPNWGQSTIFSEIDIVGNPTIQLGNLTYQGLQFGSEVDASEMEFIHIDIWTADAEAVKFYPISASTGENFVQLDLIADQWNSFDIPVTEFTDQGLSMADLIQFKFVGVPWAEGTIFYDNLYFYRTASGADPFLVEDFEGTPPEFVSFGNIADTEVVANPDASGENTSANVAQFTKTNGAETWAGAFFEISAPLDLVTYANISVKTWSPKKGAVVRLKIENQDASITHSVDVNTAIINGWETLVYDFSGAPKADYVRIVLFFDFGNNGDDSVYYFDEITLLN